MITSVNNQPVRVEDVVEGGRLAPGERAGDKGVVVGHQTRLGMLAHFKVDDGYESRFQANHSLSVRQVGHDDPDKVGCIVLLRKGEATLPALKDIEAKVKELNDPASGRMLPGVQIVPYYDRKELTSVTTDTVTENLLIGMGLVTMVLLLFLSNVRTALDRGDQHSAGAAVRLCGALSAGQVGKSAVHRRGGLRHHRRFLGDHHREHLPPPGRRGERRCCR